MNSNPVDPSWIPIEKFDLGPRVPVLVLDPDWYDSSYPNAKVAQGYYDQWEKRWFVVLFCGESAYAWVTYTNYKPKFYQLLPTQ